MTGASRPARGLAPSAISSRGSWTRGYAGYFVVEVLSQALWRDDPLAVARRCHAGAVKVLESV
jgi:hypothetical protein